MNNNRDLLLTGRPVCAAGQPACPQVSRCLGLFGTDREYPALTGRSGTYAFGASNIALAEWVMDGVTRDGLTVHLEGVAVIEVKRGKMVHARDYIFDPSLLEPIWGRREEHVSTAT